MNSDKLHKLNEAIRDVVEDIEAGRGLFTPATREWMVEVLADSIIRRTAKFCKGQQEHGGDFLTKEMKIVGMIQEESDDSFWYFERFKLDVQKMLDRYAQHKKLQSTNK